MAKMTRNRVALRLFRLLALVLGLYAAAVTTIFVLQRPLLFQAERAETAPAAFGVVDAEVVSMPTPDGETLAGWYRRPDAGKPTLLFFHGKGGHLGHRNNRWKLYAARGYGILFFDYRGFGESTGTATDAGLRRDALTAYDWLRGKTDASHIILTAESLGTGLAVYVAAERDCAGVSLMSGYSSIADIAARRYWWAPVGLLMSDRFETLPSAARVKAPVLLQHGEIDRTIPIEFAERLFAAFTGPKTFERLPGIGHNNDFGMAQFEREFTFVDERAAK